MGSLFLKTGVFPIGLITWLKRVARWSLLINVEPFPTHKPSHYWSPHLKNSQHKRFLAGHLGSNFRTKGTTVTNGVMVTVVWEIWAEKSKEGILPTKYDRSWGPSQTFCVDAEICHNTALGRWFVSVSDPALKESVMDDGLLSSAKRLKPTRFKGQE